MKERPSLRYTRVTIAFMVICLLSLGVIDFIIVSDQRRIYLENADARARTEMELVATFVTEPMLRFQFAYVEQFIQQWGEKNADVVLFRAVTPTGNLLTEYRRETGTEHPLEVKEKVVFAGRHILDLEMISDLEVVEHTISDLQRQMILWSVIVTMIIGMVLWVVLKLLALRPLEEEIRRRRQAEEGLQGANEALEERVRKRTLALTETNEDLEREIGDRRRAEESLADEKEHLSVTLRSIGDGVITTDIEGRIVLMNKVAEALTGWPLEEALGRPLGEVFYIIHEKTRERCESPAEKVLETGTVVALANHTALVARDGAERIIADSGAPIRDKGSNIMGVVLVFRDVTEKSRLEEELIKVEKLESVSVLAGGIAHDFNNILTAILGNINLAAYQIERDEETYHLLMAAEKATIRAKDLTQQLLTFAKGGEPIKEAASAEMIIRDSANFVLHGSNVNCRFSIPEKLWLMVVDKGQISQVIQNVIINARQSMPEGGTIGIECENVEKDGDIFLPLADGKYVRIRIRDQGVGIPENILGKIFDPFFSTKQQGNGLGLAITHSIVMKHAGHISVDSKPGEGSVFTMYLPAVEGPAASGGEDGERALALGTGRILVMDDEEVVREVATRMLTHAGYEVIAVEDGAGAVDAYRRSLEGDEKIAAVILDLTVPGGMGGREAVEEILALDPAATVVVSSGYSNDPVIARYREHGFKGAVVKPYRLDEVLDVLKTVISEDRD